MSLRRLALTILSWIVCFSCRPVHEGGLQDESHARWFSLDSNAVVLVSPFDGSRDTIPTERPMRRLVCMSTSYIGYLSSFGAEDAVVGVSGLQYVSDSSVRARAVDVGYDALPDYERILSLRPDLVVAYSVSSVQPRYLGVLRSLGIRVALVSDHLESHPLARAEYIRLFGALTGRRVEADSVYAAVCASYQARMVRNGPRKKVLVNMPYGDQWYIPGGDNYMTRLIMDAGGEVLGAVQGESESSVISVESFSCSLTTRRTYFATRANEASLSDIAPRPRKISSLYELIAAVFMTIIVLIIRLQKYEYFLEPQNNR